MNVDELYDLVEDFFGYKAKMRYINSATKEVACVLYDSFLLKCNLDDQYTSGEINNIFTIGDISKKTINKFLDSYYKAYVLSQYDDCDI